MLALGGLQWRVGSTRTAKKHGENAENPHSTLCSPCEVCSVIFQLASDSYPTRSANPATRPSPSQFLEDANKPGHYLKDDFVDTNLFLEEFAIKEDDAKARFFKKLPDVCLCRLAHRLTARR